MVSKSPNTKQIPLVSYKWGEKNPALPVASTHPAVPNCVEPQAGVDVIQREEGDLFSLAYQYPVDTPPSHQAMTP